MNQIRTKDVIVGEALTANTWYSYSYSNDADLKDATILGLYASFYGVTNPGTLQINLNRQNKVIWYWSSINTLPSGATITVSYIA